MDILVGILVGLVVVALAGLVSYNRFVEQRNLIHNSWSNIDVELQRRYDLIPNLVETVKGYAAHERQILARVAEARSAARGTSGSAAAQARAERPLVAALRQLLAVVESYPKLKASEGFLALQNELATTEDRLAAARRFYNSNVRDYNRRVESVPSNLIASLGGFELEEYFEVEEAVRRAPEVEVA